MPARDIDDGPEPGETYGEWLRRRIEIRLEEAGRGWEIDETARVGYDRDQDPDFEDPARRDLNDGCAVEIHRLPDGQFYWHLYRGKRRVNGGLADTWIRALRSARIGSNRL